MLRPSGKHELIALAILGLCAGIFVLGHVWAQHVTPQLGLLCLGGVGLCLILRFRLATLACALAAVFLLFPVVPNYLPHAPAARPGCSITVITFNKLVDPPDDAGAARLLVELHPDVIFIQKAYDATAFRDVLLAQGFSGYFNFVSPTKPDLILSRFPIQNTDDDRSGIWVEVDIAGRTVRLKSMYAPRPNYDFADYQMFHTEIRRQAQQYAGPLILAGDANATPYTPEIGALDQVVVDSWNEAGFGLGATFPGPWRRAGILGPWLRIDYIFHNAAFDTAAVRRIDAAVGAGHYPVWAELIFAGEGQTGTQCP